MNPKDFEFIAGFVRDKAAIVLEAGKEYLVETRLTPLARKLGYASLEELIAKLRIQRFGELADAVVDAMTTNETSFFRDVHPFAALREHVLPAVMEKRDTTRKLRIWCGAASSGQEPYTIAMVIREMIPKAANWNIEFVCTDISPTMLERCQEGLYSQQEVNRGLPASYLVKHFQREGAKWRVKEDLRNMIRFQPLNLIRPFTGLGKYDIVFLRNVLIYFDVPTKQAILRKIRDHLDPEGFFFLGTAETTYSIDSSFKREEHGKAVFYRP